MKIEHHTKERPDTGANSTISVKVGEVTLSMSCNPPYDEINALAMEDNNGSRAGKAYWYGREKRIKAWTHGRECQLLYAAEKLR